MTQTHYDANDVLMGGAGSPAWKFDAPGVRKVGTITAPPQTRQEREYDPNNPGGGAPKVFPSGDPIMGVFVEVQTDERDPSKPGDDGKRTFYIEGRRLKDATKAGVREAGARGLEVGGVLDVTLTHYDVPNDRRSGCNWTIAYTPAGNAALMGNDPQGDYSATGGSVAAPAQIIAPPTPPAAPQSAVAAAAGNVDPKALAEFQAWQQQQAQQQTAPL